MSTATQDPPAATTPATIPIAAPVVPAAAAVATPDATKVTPASEAAAPSAKPDVAALVERKSLLGQAEVPAIPTTPAQAAAAPTTPATDLVYALKAPEGVDKVLAEQLVLQATEFAKANKVAPEMAQKVLDRDLAQRQAIHAQAQAMVTKQWNDYETAAKADPQIGGHKYDETIRLAARAMAEVPDALRDLLRKSAMGSHPEVLRYLSQRGKALSEGAAIDAASDRSRPAEVKGKNLWYPPKSTSTFT